MKFNPQYFVIGDIMSVVVEIGHNDLKPLGRNEYLATPNQEDNAVIRYKKDAVLFQPYGKEQDIYIDITSADSDIELLKMAKEHSFGAGIYQIDENVIDTNCSPTDRINTKFVDKKSVRDIPNPENKEDFTFEELLALAQKENPLTK